MSTALTPNFELKIRIEAYKATFEPVQNIRETPSLKKRTNTNKITGRGRVWKKFYVLLLSFVNIYGTRSVIRFGKYKLMN